MNKQPYRLFVDPLKRMCEITFYFDDGAAFTLPTRYYPGIEDDIRRNFYAWRAHAVAYCHDRAVIDNVLNELTAIKTIEYRNEGDYPAEN
jgi:hypothetical protein